MLFFSNPELATPTTSYANTGGMGDRTALGIVVTLNFTPLNGTGIRAIDGSYTGNSSGAFQVPNGSAAAGETVEFDFTALGMKYMDKIRTYSNANFIGATGLYEYWNGSAWVSMCSAFTFNTSDIETSVSMPPEGTLKVRWRATGGTFSASGYWTETEFKLAAGAV